MSETTKITVVFEMNNFSHVDNRPISREEHAKDILELLRGGNLEVKLMARTEGVGELAGLTVGQILAYVARVSNPSNHNYYINALEVACGEKDHF